MRISMIPLLSILLVTPMVGASDFRLFAGEEVRGVHTASGRLFTPDTVCRGGDCYPILQSRPLSRAQLDLLNIERFSFRLLAEQGSLRREGNALLLPVVIGQQLYRDARAYELRESRLAD